MKLNLMKSVNLNNKFAALEHNLASLVEYINKLAKRLNTPKPMVFQPSSGCQPLVIPSLQNQGANIVISKGSGVATCVWKLATCNVHGINVFAKQEDIFDGVRIFSSGLNKRFLGAGVAIIMNNFLAYYVSKVEKISGHLISVRLLFKGKLSIVILGLYAGASAETRFSQACKINFFIAKAVNSSTFVSRSKKSASFKFCLDLGLVNFFSGYLLVKASIWGNSKGIIKVIDYIFVSKSLLSAVADHKVVPVSDFFDIDHNTVLVSVGLSGFLDVYFNNDCIQANKNKWKFKIKNANVDKWSCFRECSLNKFLENMDLFNDAKDAGNLDVVTEGFWSLFLNIVNVCWLQIHVFFLEVIEPPITKFIFKLSPII
ncbi:hypothetical protein G9A89_003939 [Geosiphon pyriformis]|nr:hypothetical protein G9A89_003939 [Geosiphon pyriformis]